MRAIMTDSEIIDEMGGTSEVARMFEIDPASVSEWRKKGFPKARVMTLRLMRPDLMSRRITEQQEAA